MHPWPARKSERMTWQSERMTSGDTSWEKKKSHRAQARLGSNVAETTQTGIGEASFQTQSCAAGGCDDARTKPAHFFPRLTLLIQTRDCKELNILLFMLFAFTDVNISNKSQNMLSCKLSFLWMQVNINLFTAFCSGVKHPETAGKFLFKLFIGFIRKLY